MPTTPVRPAVWPHPSAPLVHRPLPAGAVTLTGGPWEERRRTNAGVSLAHGLEQLHRTGAIANFADLADGGGGRRHGHLDAFDKDAKNFVDSDVYKWLEAVAWARVGNAVPGAVLDSASRVIDLVVAAQAEDGYLNTWFQTQDPASRFSDMAHGHELYCLGHLLQAGIAWQRTCADGRLLRAGRRFADFAVERFGAADAVCGHPCVEMALVELSRETTEPAYARLAAAMVDRRGRGALGAGRFGAAYYQDDRPYRQMSTLDGHAVRATYLAAAATDLGIDLKDGELRTCSLTQWRNLRRSRLYVTGGLGSRHLGESIGEDYELPADAAYCETCAAIGLVMWSWRLMLDHRDGAIADLIERAVYNAILSGVSLDGSAFHYVNPLDTHAAHPRQSWFEIACCPPNAMRAIATLDQMIATEDDGGVQVHQFVACRVDAGDGRVLRVDTGYPADGSVVVHVLGSPGREWELAIRVPAWSANGFALSVNGAALRAAVSDGYVGVRRDWRPGDTLTLELDMSVRMVRADPRISGLHGMAAVERGPVVYSLDEAVDGAGHPAFTILQADLDARLAPSPVSGVPNLDVEVVREAPADRDWPYADEVTSAARAPGRAQLVPFAHVGNLRAGVARTWLPLRRP